MTLIIWLVVAGLFAIFFEVVLPGGILGIIGILCLLAATWVAAGEFGWVTGAVVFFGSIVGGLVVLVAAFKMFADTSFGKRFFLHESVKGHTRAGRSEEDLVGKQGRTRTRLNPVGMVTIDGASFEAFSQDGYVEADQPVEVVGKDNFKLIIKKL